MAHLTTRQIKQLLEIDGASSGIRSQVQELIVRLTYGGVGLKSKNPRIAQAKRLWDKGFGRELRIDHFGDYLETIPMISEELTVHDERFPELVLVDARLGVVKTCELLGVDYNGTDETFEDFDSKQSRTEKVYWARIQDGKKNRNESVHTCRSDFADDEIGLTVYEGLAFFAQKPKAFRNWAMDLTDSVDSGVSGAACLDWYEECPWLCYDERGGSSAGSNRCGSGSRRA